MQSVRYCFAALLSLLILLPILLPAQSLVVDFRQGANNDRPRPLGEVHWINSVLQNNNAVYFEGMSVPQRILLKHIPATPGNQHTLTFSHLALKNGIHAYDYLTSYAQAQSSAALIASANLLSSLNECGGSIGPPRSLSNECVQLHAHGYSITVDAPDNMGWAGPHDVAASASAYESALGNRTVQIYGDAPIVIADLQFNGYSGGKDLRAEYTLTWESPSSFIIVEMAAHLSMGMDVPALGAGVGYGSGSGSGSISGAPFHVRLGQLDGMSLGSRDNQIMASAIMSRISCAVAGPDPVCTGSRNTYRFNGGSKHYSYSWSLSGNTSGAAIVGSTTGSSVEVLAGSSAGAYTLSVKVNDGFQTVTCPVNVSVSGLSVTAASTPITCKGGSSTVTVAAAGGTPPYSGTGTFNKTAGTYTFTVTDAGGCSGSATVSLAEPALLEAFSHATTVSCSTNMATVNVSARGGKPPYKGIGSFQRGAGKHTFVVTDDLGCQKTTTVDITASATMTVAASATPILCSGGSSTVTVTATGGTPPYTGTGSFTRSAGTYAFTVTDANGCSGTTNVTITEPAALTASANASTISCGGGDATVTVTASGGTPPYSGTGTFTRGAGTYSFPVTDANNCVTTATITISAPAALSVSASASPIACSGGSAPVTVTATGGTPPYTGIGTFSKSAGTHTFTVTDANNCTASTAVTISEPPALSASASATAITCSNGSATVTVTAAGGTPPYTGTGTFSRGAGTHTFTVSDANNCTTTTSVTITAPSTLLATANAMPISCNGGSSTVTVSASGGTPPYSGTGTFTRSAGTYTFTVTDVNNCSAAATVTITQPPAMTATVSATPIACNGGSSTVTVSASGGTPPYSGTGTFSRGAGTYTFTVTDASSCAVTRSVTISEPPALSAAASATQILCNGSNATVTVTASGGTPPYTGTGTFSRGAGTHTFTVTDAKNCTATTSVTITSPSSLTASASASPITCNGGNSTVTVTASGGAAPYTGTGTFTRGAGTYTFTVTDANNCTATTSVTITEPPTLRATAGAGQILCNGGSTSVTVTASGGTAPYTGTGTFSKSAGSYTFTVTDANGCTDTANVTITEPPAITVTASATPISCANGNSTVTVTATGGTPPYAGTGTFTRGAGTYTFAVTDANNCAASATVSISAPSTLTAAASASPILCNGGSSTITVTASGGTPPYVGTGQFSRGAGTYTFTVTDANSCSDQVTVSVTEPPLLRVTATAGTITCNGGDATVTVTANGGTAPYTGAGTFTRGAGTHTFTVTDANGCSASATVTITQPPALVADAQFTPILCNGSNTTVTITATGGSRPYSGTGSFSRGAGRHTFVVTDASGCTDTLLVVLTDPPLLTASSSAGPILCNGGSSTITVTAAGGTPPYSGTGTFSRKVGTHTFTVTDSVGCTATTTVTISEPPLLNASASATDILCNGGDATVTVTAAGGTPPYSGTGTFTRGAGTFSFTVTDANNCTATATVTISEPPKLTVDADAPPIACHGGTTFVTVSASGGTAPYTGTGSFSRGTGTFSFTVTDANGCTDSASITLAEPPLLTASASATPILCHGNNSTVTVTATGGTLPYSGTGSFTRGAGTHTFVVTDNNGCKDSVTVTITEPPLLAASATATPIDCNGGTSTVTITATGGTPPYTGTGTFFRGAGTYTFTVTDSAGCSASTTVTIGEPPAINAFAAAGTILCNGGGTTVIITASGGTPPYNGTGTFTRSAGTHSFVVTDAKGCSDTVSVTLTEPPPLTMTVTATNIACNGDKATVLVTASGGTPPYSGVGSFQVAAGTHTFTVTDRNGCKVSKTITVTEPPPLTATATANPLTCGRDTTAVVVTAQGGTPPYTGTGTFYRGLGTHTFTVTDSNNCVTQAIVTVTGPPPVVISVNVSPILCYGQKATIDVTASGGTPPYTGVGTYTRGPGTYVFTVTDKNGCKDQDTVTIVEPPELFMTAAATPILCYGDLSTVTVQASGGTPPYSGTGTFQRGAGTYTFTVTDANGCTKSTTLTIVQPPQLVASASSPSVTCGRDSAAIVVSAIGGTPAYNGTGTFYRTPGTYTFIVTDANGCADTVTATVNGPPPVYATAAATPILCNGGNTTITVTAYGGTPPYSGTGTFTRQAGTHTFVVTDANGCTDTATIYVPEPPALSVICKISDCDANGFRTVSAVVSGGTPPYNYLWSPGSVTAPTFQVPCHFNGTISLLLRDANYDPSDPNKAACEAFCTMNIVAKESRPGEAAPGEYALYRNYPNPFNPSTTIEYQLPEPSHVRLSIVNRLGQTVAVLVDEEVGAGLQYAVWNTDAGASLPTGSYFYRIQARSLVSERKFVRERMMLLLK